MATTKELKEAGFTPKEISEYTIRTSKKLKDGGFSQGEIDDYFGIKSESTLKTIGREVGDMALGTLETPMALASGAVLYPFAKAYGVMALPWGAEAAKQAEQSISNLGYQPQTKSGKGAVGVAGQAIEKFLTPARKVGEALEPISPRLAYLGETMTEFGEFALTGGITKGVKKIKPLLKQTKQGVKVMNLIRKRGASIEKSFLDSEYFIRDLEGKLSKQELDAMPFIRQGIKDPRYLKDIGREDLIPIIENPSAKLKAQTERVGKYYDESFEFLREHWGDPGFVKDYVTQIWDIPKNRTSEVVNHFATKNPFLKKRTIPTLEEGIKLGLKPKTTNIAELLRVYDQYKIKTAFNNEFAQKLKVLQDADGNPLMLRGDKAPADWVTIEHSSLQRAMPIGKVGDEGIMLMKKDVKVHPEIAKEVKIIFDKPFDHGAIRAYETINAFAKKTMLTASLFHHFALTESAFSTGIGRKAVKQWNPFKIVRELRSGNYEIFQKMPLAKDAIDAGVTFGALSDIQRGKIENALFGLERATKNTPGLKYATKGLRKANQIWDAQLWDYYHNSLKLYAYEANVQSGLKSANKATRKKFNRDMNPEEIKAVKQEMGSFVNDSFGGQNWDLNRVLGNPKMRQMLQWGLLAPDWTLSVLKQAAAPAKGAYLQATASRQPTVPKAVSQKLRGKALTKRGAMFWARAAIYFNLVAQSANYYNTKKEYGEGRFTWDNAPGHGLNIFAGRNEDGTEKYIRMGKQFREVMEWGIEPEKKLGAKLSPVLREGMRQITRHDPGSGYPTEFADEDWWSKKGLTERAKSIAEMPLPFSLRPYIESRPTNFMFSLPASRGMTKYKAVQLFKSALQKGDAEKVKKVFISALENHIDAEQSIKTAASLIGRDATMDNRMVAEQIIKELKSVSGRAKSDLVQVYKKRGILTPEILGEMNKIFRKQEKVSQLRGAFGVRGN